MLMGLLELGATKRDSVYLRPHTLTRGARALAEGSGHA